MPRTFAEDYEKGLENEERVRVVLEECFEEPLTKLDPKHPMDYLAPGGYFEIKGRGFHKDKYETTMIPYSKVRWADEKTSIPVTFVFSFTDGIYYIHYNPDQFKEYDIMDFQRRARPDHFDREQLYCYIPISDLTKIEAIPKSLQV